jgi:pantoate--beta-alanine ligase
MTTAFFLDTSIIACPTVREADGLAMSSRNKRLSDKERALAPLLYETLSSSRTEEEMSKWLKSKGVDVDYIERRGTRLIGAVRIGSTRLIDNVES